MGAFLRLGGLGLSFGLLVACGGSEFSADGETGGSDSGSGGSGGSGGSAAAGGSGGSGGQSGSGGAADASTDAAQGSCTSELFQKTCMEVTTGNGVCDTCGRGKCCAQTEACLADNLCAQELRCYLENCLGVSAVGCVLNSCQACLGASTMFITVSSCLQSNCSADCPMLIP